jgi:hypothetical protein
MKSAKEAKEETYIVANEEEIICLEDVEKHINNAIKSGEYSTYYYDYIPEEAIKKLKKLGYSIEDYSSQKDGYTYRIEWQ